VRVWCCGVRGSTPSPGAEFVRVGGHTSCLALAHDGQAPSLVLDAGTGLRRVSEVLGGQPFVGTILLTHLHWDHVQGLPFFAAGDRDDAVVTVQMPAQGNPKEVLSRAMSPPHFPIGPDGLKGRWRFEAMEPGTHSIEGFDIEAIEVPHKGGRTYGYRIADGHATLGYLPDHAPRELGDGPDGHGLIHDAALRLAADADLLVHGAQFTARESMLAAEYGHATQEYAVALGEAAHARTLWLFHHSPSRTDAAVDALVQQCTRATIPVAAAIEGTRVDLR